MARGHKPVSGSRGYWHRKRAIRIYPRISTVPPAKAQLAAPLAFAGYKAGMTQVLFTDNRTSAITAGMEVSRPVTVIECPNLVVCGMVFYRNTYNGLVCLGSVMIEKPSKELKRKTSLRAANKAGKRIEDLEKAGPTDVRLLVHTKPKEAGIGKKKPELFEIPLAGEFAAKLAYAKSKIGQEISAADVFRLGEYVDVKAVTKGKGYQGVVKRFGVKIRSRKNKKKRRHIGNIGTRSNAKVLPNTVPFAGQMGYHNRTEYNKRIVKIGKTGNEATPDGGFVNYGVVRSGYILLEGSVPGPKKRLVILRKAMRPKVDAPVEVRKIVLDSQQG